MVTHDNVEKAIEVLQQLGLKEYEARCFVGLCRLSKGTAKQLSEITDVPRTRVYDAIRVLESEGLVEVQHSSPQEFRAVSLSEATSTLRTQYEARIEQLEDSIVEIDPIETPDESSRHEVWTLSGVEAVDHRTHELIRNASSEIVLVLGDVSLLTDELVAHLNGVGDGVDILLGSPTEPARERIRSAVPAAEVFVAGPWWFDGDAREDVSIRRMMFVDRSTVLVSSTPAGNGTERAVFGEGFENGLVVMVRRIVTGRLLGVDPPGEDGP